ncbi:O-antigen ligase family protein [Sphingomonas sp. RRHST34]|uniref:O-antigen ligase family protein n=1 Tax=Sphingomonas citri TaxID=2862499 RepID=A0ABS7BSK5_9SPHN|nr:O-antigen ligase family protein [Sphingomonas citri]MBW6532576.1 O-antigen ligase family protein [Sphingomonas citri]
MSSAHRSRLSGKFSVSLCLLAGLLAGLWLAGGASRPDVLGQAIVRGAAWLSLITMSLIGERPAMRRVALPAVLLSLVALLPLLQLIPLPVALWQSLPGRDLLREAAAASGQSQPWRPWSMVPAATANALGALIVPAAVLVLTAGLRERERGHLPAILLTVVLAGTLVGLLQASGAGFGNALINGTPGDVSGTFANRNHFALFVAIGCVVVPSWAFNGGRRSGWRGPVALGLMPFFVLTLLATGSRAGLAVGAMAVALALVLARQGLRRELRRAPRWVLPTTVAALVAVLALLIGISITADRAQSINRLVTIDAAQDTRLRALPTVLKMVTDYFPAGTGFGSFDPIFRANEPYALLKPTFFNHAHNDFLEIVLDGGAAGLVVLVSALVWWAMSAVRAMRAPMPDALPARTGAAILLLIMVASVFDYPARTPLMMAVIALAASWLAYAPPPAE